MPSLAWFNSRMNKVLHCKCVSRSKKKELFECTPKNGTNVPRLRVWATSCENMSSGICGQRRPRSACASAQSDLDVRCSLPESLDTIECINRGQMPGWDFPHTWDLNLYILRMLEDTFSLGTAHIYPWLTFLMFTNICERRTNQNYTLCNNFSNKLCNRAVWSKY